MKSSKVMKLLSSIDSIELRSIELTLNEVSILNGLNMVVKKNGIHCILGPNGTGKTITNKIIGLLIEPNKGIIKWNDIDVTQITNDKRLELRRTVGFMAQHPAFLSRSLADNIEVPLVIRGLPKEERKKMVNEGLKDFQLMKLKNRNPSKLSIGQRQKAALLRALIHHPKILILDEPTSALDLANTKWFESHILEIKDEFDPIIFWTSHDQFQVRRVSTTVSIIYNGKVEDSGSTDQVMYHPKSSFSKSYLDGKLI